MHAEKAERERTVPIRLVTSDEGMPQRPKPRADEDLEASEAPRLSEIRDLRPGPAPSFELLPLERVVAKTEALFASWHEEVINQLEHTVLIALRSRSRLRIDNEELSMAPGSVALVPPGVAFAQRAEGSAADRIVITLRTERIELQGPAVFTPANGRARELGTWLAAEQRSGADFSGAYLDAVVELFVLELNRLQRGAGAMLERSTRAYVLEHLAENITLQDLAAAAGMSRFHFCRVYHKLSGESPMASVRRIRMERARELAQTTDMGLREIAARVGVGSHCHLSRTLRGHFGVGVRGLRGEKRSR